MNFWDQQYSSHEYRYGKEPNQFLAEHARHFQSGSRILLPGDGEGRNSVWLAMQGHHVLSVDLSEIGLNKTRKLAQENGVMVQTEIADLADWTPPSQPFDVIAMTYLHLPANIRTLIHQKVAQTLRKGGLLVIEAFHPHQLNHHSGGPQSIEMLYSLEQLRADFQGYALEQYGWEGEVMLAEGRGHQGSAHITRFVGHRS